jgi:valyl-tRNA synthetase
MTQEAGDYAGMDRYEAREKVVADLEAQGLIEQIEEHAHNIGQCQRCETVVEPLVSKQWFVKAKPLAEVTVEAVKAGRTVFVPRNYERVYFEWMNNIHDWCISRQLWWGHRIPAWYCGDCRKITVAREVPQNCEHCQGESLEQESDVLDTWFSSALWPFSTMGWPDQTPDLERYYPTSTLVTGFDIIFFWVARMMMMGMRFMGDVPFRTVHINGLVRDEKGQKMSKSRGNVIDPLEIMDEYGTDAMRFTLAIMAVPGTDIPFSISRMAGYRAFCNKIWNAGRFLLLNLDDETPASAEEIGKLRENAQLDLGERWILSRLQRVISETNNNLEKFRFHEASNELYHFFWHEFCDWFVELAKRNMTGEDPNRKQKTCRVVIHTLEESLKLLHPFIPFITEELWQEMPHSGDSLMVAPYPVDHPEWIDRETEEQMEGFQELVTGIRTTRSENNIDPRKKIPVELVCEGSDRSFLESQNEQIRLLAHLSQVDLVPRFQAEGRRVQGVSRLADFALILDEVVDEGADRQRLNQQISRSEENVQRLQKQLENSDFVNKAPEPVVAAARERHAEAVEQLEKLQEKLDGLSQP